MYQGEAINLLPPKIYHCFHIIDQLLSDSLTFLVAISKLAQKMNKLICFKIVSLTFICTFVSIRATKWWTKLLLKLY